VQPSAPSLVIEEPLPLVRQRTNSNALVHSQRGMEAVNHPGPIELRPVPELVADGERQRALTGRLPRPRTPPSPIEEEVPDHRIVIDSDSEDADLFGDGAPSPRERSRSREY